MSRLIVAFNPFEPDKYVVYDTSAGVFDSIKAALPEWPANARIYHNCVSLTTDVTPACDEDIDYLNSLSGDIYVVVYPANPLMIIIVVLAVAAIAYAFSMKPDIPETDRKIARSPNNELSDRTNKARPTERIPDIFGTVRSTPDLIAVPYKFFVDHQEVEHTYMCIGRGSYDVDDIRDDETPINQISGTSIEVWSPFTNPSTSPASFVQYRHGDPILEPLYSVKRSNSVNGQEFRPPKTAQFTGASNVRFYYPNEVRIPAGLSVLFTDLFDPGDIVNISNCIVTDSGNTFDMTGNYKVLAVSSTTLVLSNPASENSYWSEITETSVCSAVIKTPDIVYFGSDDVSFSGPNFINMPSSAVGQFSVGDYVIVSNSNTTISGAGDPTNLDGQYRITAKGSNYLELSNPTAINPNWEFLSSTEDCSAIIRTPAARWVGPFIVDLREHDTIMCNFVALNGIYQSTGSAQYNHHVALSIEYAECDADGNITGDVFSFAEIVQGSRTTTDTRASTVRFQVSPPSYYSIRIRRTNPTPDSDASIQEELKWRDLYTMKEIIGVHLGDVTTIRSMSYSTAGALAVKDRKLNLLASRLIPSRGESGTFSPPVATSDMADIIVALTTDPHIGNMTINELDLDSIYGTRDRIIEVFGSALVAQFNYTFDDYNASFENAIQSVCGATMCTPYRRGSKIKLSFVAADTLPTVLFNHRNKLPRSEARSVRFGRQEEYDGLELVYLDDEYKEARYIIPDEFGVNRKEIKTVGVVGFLQAYFLAWREWGKVLYQNVFVEFEATAEANIVVRGDKILVSDGTRSSPLEGEIVSQNILELELSQPVYLDPLKVYNIFVQHYDGTIESIELVSSPSAYKVVLANAPRLPLHISSSQYANPTYLIASDEEVGSEREFLVVVRENIDLHTSRIQAQNFDSRIFQHDSDHINGIIS